MEKTAWIVCNAFLQKAGTSKRNALLRYLPPSQQETLNSLPQPVEDPTLGFQKIEDLMGRIHYSWFPSFLRNLSETEVRLFLSCLSEESSKKLQKALLFSSPLVPLSPLAKTYLQQILFKQLLPQDKELLPIECLPSSPLNTLLELPIEEFRLLIDFLGLHDLAVEIRQIIDTVKLKKIHSVLTKEKEAYLRSLLQKKEAVVFKRMELNKWDGKAESLQTVLHHRGINRLAKALYPEDPSLVWYISHQLPWEQATLLLNLCKSLEHTKAASILTSQIMEILSLIQPKKSEAKL